VIVFGDQVDGAASELPEAGGAQAFVGKPFNPQELVTRAKDLLGS
jgi:response regulator RpfG family c-di-GMP phosphodiesterase